MPTDNVRELALDIARLLDTQKAENVLVFEVAQLTPIADYFVIATGTNMRHLKALARRVADRAEERGKHILGQEGVPESGWVLVDIGDVIVHLFAPQKRELYNLEVLWGDAREIATERSEGAPEA